MSAPTARRRANVVQGTVHVTADECPAGAAPFVAYNGICDYILLTEQEARDMRDCLDAALLQWDGKA